MFERATIGDVAEKAGVSIATVSRVVNGRYGVAPATFSRVKAVIDDLVRIGTLKSRRDIQNVYVERISDSYPIYHRSYPEELERARRELSRFGNLHLAGRTGLFWYNNMDHSIENAMQLSKRLLRDSGRTDADEALLAQGRLPMAS